MKETENQGRNEFRPMKAVYSYYFPEIRQIINQINRDYPHEIFLTSSPVSLDDFHEPVIDKLFRFYKDQVPNLDGFKYRYPTSGSSEGIREYLSLLQQKGVRRIYALEGEYEGFRETAKTRGIATVEVDLEKIPADQLEPGHWFISNPSARDGNIIQNRVIDEICDAGHKVFYDLAYVGSTEPYRFDLSHENVEAAAISLSKPLGLFRYRIGFTFSREEIPALYANKWFKSIPALMIAEKVFDQMELGELVEKYKPVQGKIISEINQEQGLELQPADAILLANLRMDRTGGLNEEQMRMIEPFKRGGGYRFCLTRYYEKKEWEG